MLIIGIGTTVAPSVEVQRSEEDLRGGDQCGL
jgi:hypothetical protein